MSSIHCAHLIKFVLGSYAIGHCSSNEMPLKWTHLKQCLGPNEAHRPLVMWTSGQRTSFCGTGGIICGICAVLLS